MSKPAGPNQVSALSPEPVFAFGHGLSYSPAVWEETRLASGDTWSTSGQCELTVTLANPVGASSSDIRAMLTLQLSGPRRVVGYDRRRTGEIAIEVPR